MFTLIRIFWNRHLNVVRKVKYNRWERNEHTCMHCYGDLTDAHPYVVKVHGYQATFCDSTCHGLWTTTVENIQFSEWVDGALV